MKKLLTFLLAVSIGITLAGCTKEDLRTEKPIIEGVEYITITIGDSFDEMEGVNALDPEGGDLTSSITVESNVNIDVPGVYTVVYSVTDNYGMTVTATRTVTVVDVELEYPTGLYDFKFASADLKHSFLASAEKWLLENQVGGIPIFSSASFFITTPRMQLPVESNISVMGYGIQYATMTEDDSTVLMYDGNYGNAGEYTYRTFTSGHPVTFNQWLYDTSTDEDLMEYYVAPLYRYDFNDDKNGFELVPDMAERLPVPINGETLDNGNIVSDVWQISLKDDLEWFFHPETLSQTGFNPDNYDSEITAQDYIDTFKLALDEQWFRAVAGGGDFLSSANRIKGAQDYVDGKISWDEVGLKAIDEYTLQFEYVHDMSEYDVKYASSSIVAAPINIDLYNHLDEYEYGTSVVTLGYTGPYYIDEYEEGVVLRMKENPKYHSNNTYFYTGVDFLEIYDHTTMFEMFEAGKVDVVGVPTTKVEEYYNYPTLYKVTGPTVYKIMINSLKTEENMREYNPSSDYIPEPILGHPDFKKAMFFAIDRDTLANDLLKVRASSIYYFNDLYVLDVTEGLPYRNTEYGQSVGENLFPETEGYNKEEAIRLFKKAVDELLLEGYYSEGTEGNYSTIYIDLNNYMGSDSWDLVANYIEETFEDTFIYEEKYIKVEIDVQAIDFPSIYYDYMMPGEFDLSFGGISACTLCPSGLLDDFSSDNRSGFFINPGVDTSKAEIEVRYQTPDGEYHREMWSLDAISSAFEGEIYVQNGVEGDLPEVIDIQVTPTTLQFTTNMVEHTYFENITYTIEEYDFSSDVYVELEGFVDVPLTEQVVTITDLTPFYFGHDENSQIVYQGDYQIKLDFDYKVHDKSDYTLSQWFEMEELIKESDVVEEVDSYQIALEVNQEDYARTISDIEVFLGGNIVGDAVIEQVVTANLLGNSITYDINISNITMGEDYILRITFDDGLVTYISL